jgi:pimeloyl-ACP methyl ester carboxylesterase
MEEVIEFNASGNILRGIIHIPERSLTQKIGINLLNPGIKYRVGPHRLNVKLARQLCHRGYFVLRFDPTGVGDSEGDLPLDSVANLWFRVEQGLYRNDIFAANQFFADHVKLDELYLMGLCGGAISAILAGVKDKNVTRLILIDVPVTLAKGIRGDADFITSTDYANQIYSHYKTRLINPKSWLRFFSLQSDYKAIGKTLWFKLKNIIKSNKGNGKFSIHSQKFNYLFLEAFEKCIAQNKHVFFICSGKSYTTGEFQELFQKNYLYPESPYTAFCKVAIIPAANHNYTLLEWQNELFNIISNWLSSNDMKSLAVDKETKYGKIQTIQHSFS